MPNVGDKVIYQGHMTRVIERKGNSHLYLVAWDNERGEQQRKTLFAKHLHPLEDGSGYEHRLPSPEETKKAHEDAQTSFLMTPEGQREYYKDTAAEIFDQLEKTTAREQIYKAALIRILKARSITAMTELAQKALQQGADETSARTDLS